MVDAQSGKKSRVAICTPPFASLVTDSDGREFLLVLGDILIQLQLGVAPTHGVCSRPQIGLKKFCQWP